MAASAPLLALFARCQVSLSDDESDVRKRAESEAKNFRDPVTDRVEDLPGNAPAGHRFFLLLRRLTWVR